MITNLQVTSELFESQNIHAKYKDINKLIFGPDLNEIHKIKYNLNVEENHLINVQKSLYQYFENAFELSGNKDSLFSMTQNRLSDVAMVWMKLLQPWTTNNRFIEAYVNLDAVQDPNVRKSTSQLNKFQSFILKKPNYELIDILAYPSLSNGIIMQYTKADEIFTNYK